PRMCWSRWWFTKQTASRRRRPPSSTGSARLSVMKPAVIAALALAACGADGPPWAIPPATTQLVVHVTDGPRGVAIPARIVLYDAGGAPLRIGDLDMFGGTVQDRGFCTLADGAIGTWMGIALARGE